MKFEKNSLGTNKKSTFSKITDFIFIGAFIFVLYIQAPTIFNSFKQQNKKMKSVQVKDLDGNDYTLPIKGQRKIYFFWATWCAPCHQQINLFKWAIENKKIKNNELVALSMGESIETVKNFTRKNNITFQIFVDPKGESWELLKVKATPTIAIVDENQNIVYYTSGLSPAIGFRAANFLNDK